MFQTENKNARNRIYSQDNFVSNSIVSGNKYVLAEAHCNYMNEQAAIRYVHLLGADMKREREKTNKHIE